MKVAILRDSDPSKSKKWENACQSKGLDYTVIDLTSNDWYERIQSIDVTLFLVRPSGLTYRIKTVFDERLYIISQVMGKRIFPAYHEIVIYENKRILSAFLKAAKISMPETEVFYSKNQASGYAKNCLLPLVAKTSIGGSGTGVQIIRDRDVLEKYISKAFSKGIKRRLGPNRNVGNVKSWSKKAYASPTFFINKVKKYLELYADAQKGFVIFQEFIPHDYEWRVAKIGNSWFGHQKAKDGDKASGTKGIYYVAPPIELLDFCKKVCDEHNFTCMSFDIFEHPEKGYVVNELQTIFGHVQDHILEVNGVKGRYCFKDTWLFEEGDFNTNESYDLRLDAALESVI